MSIHSKLDIKDTKISTVDFDGKSSMVVLESELESGTCGENMFCGGGMSKEQHSTMSRKLIDYEEKATSPPPQQLQPLTRQQPAQHPPTPPPPPPPPPLLPKLLPPLLPSHPLPLTLGRYHISTFLSEDEHEKLTRFLNIFLLFHFPNWKTKFRIGKIKFETIC